MRPDSPPSGSDQQHHASSTAAKKKKKKGKGKRVEDEYDESADAMLSPSSNANHAAAHAHAQAAAYHQQSAAMQGQTAQGAYAATAQAQADLLATASDLYRRIEADPQGIPDDDAYWTSLPAHLRTFIRNALPLGQFPASTNNDPSARHASTQAMIAVAQQLAQAAHASQRHLQQYPLGSQPYPSLPFDPAIFADLALHSDQSIPLHGHPNGGNNVNSTPSAYGHVHFSAGSNPPPTQPPGEPLPAPIMMLNEYADDTGDYDDDYYSDEDLDGSNAGVADSEHPSLRDGAQWPDSNRPVSHAGLNGHGMMGQQVSAPAAAKKKNKKKKKKSGGTGNTVENMTPAPTPTVAPNTGKHPQTQQAYAQQQQPQQQMPAPATTAPPRSTQPPPSSRAAGKQPMTFNSNASGKAAPNGHSHPPAPKRTAGSVPAAHNHGGGAQAAPHTHGQQPHPAPQQQQQQRIWSTSTAEERERIKDFWLSLRENERRSLVQLEKDAVLRKMKDQQKHNCTCAVCGRKRSAIESELEVLYNTYYEELQQYATHQQQYIKSGGALPPPPGPGPFPGSIALDSAGNVVGGNALTKAPPAAQQKQQQQQRTNPVQKKAAPPLPEDDDDYDDELDDDEYDDEYDDEEEDEDEESVAAQDAAPRRRGTAGTKQPASAGGNDVFPLGSSLTVKGTYPIAHRSLQIMASPLSRD